MFFSLYEVHPIDTPGFNDDELTDSDILIDIAEYLKTGIRLSGVLYLHPITDSRIGGGGGEGGWQKDLEMLRNLVGPENMGSVKLITTKWSGVTNKESKVRLDDLLSDFWREMVANRAQIA